MFLIGQGTDAVQVCDATGDGICTGPGHNKANKILTAAAGFAYTALHAPPLIMAANVKV